LPTVGDKSYQLDAVTRLNFPTVQPIVALDTNENMSGSSGGSTVSLPDGTTGGTTITRPQEPPPPTPTQVSGESRDPSPSSAGRTGGIENPGFEEDDERAGSVGNGGSIFISVSAPSPGLDTSMLTERKDKEVAVAEAVNLELVSMNPFSTTLDTNGVNGIPVKKDGDQAGLSDGYADAYDEYFVPVNEHRKYMRWVGRIPPGGRAGLQGPTSRQSAHRWQLCSQPYEPAALYFIWAPKRELTSVTF
jgi:hypothetical protein